LRTPGANRVPGTRYNAIDFGTRNAVPLSNQIRFNQALSTIDDKMVRDYLATLVYPFANKSRIPDSFNRSTALVSSTFVGSIEVCHNNPDDPDIGRWAVAVNPHFGSLADPASFKIAIVRPPQSSTGLWSQLDFTSPDTYVRNIDGVDPRLDPNYTMITQPPVGAYVLVQGSNANNPFPVAATAPYETATQIWSNYNTGVELQSTLTNGHNIFRVSPGQYNVHFDTKVTGNTFTQIPAWTPLTDPAGVLISIPRQTLSTDATLAVYDAQWTVLKTTTLSLDIPMTSYTQPYTNTSLSFTPTFFTKATDMGTDGGASYPNFVYPPANNGLVTSYRTVGCSLLCTYEGTTLNDGGVVSAVYASGGTQKTNFFNNNPPVMTGQYENWEKVAANPRAYSDRERDGSYSWWLPEDQDDFMFRTPDYWATAGQTNADELAPCLIASGVYLPNATITSPKVIRIMVSTVYEITTSSQLFAQEKLVGSQNVLDHVNKLMTNQPSSMANAAHMSWLKDFMGGVKKGLGYVAAPAKWIFNNRDAIAGGIASVI